MNAAMKDDSFMELLEFKNDVDNDNCNDDFNNEADANNNDDDNIGDDDINDNVADDVNDNEDIFDDADDSDDNDDWDCNTIATMIKVVMIMTTQKMFLLKH